MALDIGRAKQVVVVRDGSEGAGGGLVLAAAEVDVVEDGAAQPAVVVAEDGLDGRVLERRALDQELRVRARVDARVAQVGEEAADYISIRIGIGGWLGDGREVMGGRLWMGELT